MMYDAGSYARIFALCMWIVRLPSCYGRKRRRFKHACHFSWKDERNTKENVKSIESTLSLINWYSMAFVPFWSVSKTRIDKFRILLQTVVLIVDVL